MATTITVQDKLTGGQDSYEFPLELLKERVTVRELIRSRVFQEVKDYNAKAASGGIFRGLVKPTDAEQELNGYRLRTHRQIDFQQQYDVAIEAFEKSRFLLLVDDRQVDTLDEEIDVTPKTQVTFLKLVPLAGG